MVVRPARAPARVRGRVRLAPGGRDRGARSDVRRRATFVVDRDKAQCPHAAYASIHQAVDAAQPGDTVKVCADRYAEQVTVDKPLKLHGHTPETDAVEAEIGATAAGDCFEPIAVDPTLHTIVDPDDSTFSVAFKLQANDIVLQGFVVEGASVGIDASDSFSGIGSTTT